MVVSPDVIGVILGIMAAAATIFGGVAPLLRTQMRRIDDRFEQSEKQADRRFELIDKRFEQVDRRFEQIDKRLDRMDKRFEQIDKRLDQMEIRIQGVEASIQGLTTQFGDVKIAVTRLEGSPRRLELLRS